MSEFLLSASSLIFLMIAASGVYLLAKRFHVPYTVLLVAVGIVLAFVARVPAFSFIDDFALTPEVLLYVFLPVLLFESAYNIKYRELSRNVWTISALAVIALLISAFLTAWGLQVLFGFMGLAVPFLALLIFGSIISATDPVAVLALFKELGAPRRLTLIFEGESLFNDGTALALFLVVLSIAMTSVGAAGSEHASLFSHAIASLSASLGADLSVAGGIVSFISMIVVGISLGGIVGFAFSKAIGAIRNSEFLEISLTIALAHATFILAEAFNHFLVPTSGVIATTIAGIVVGNYGVYKISPRVQETMGHFWEFFAHVANSLVFILMGILIVTLDVPWLTLALPILLAVVVVIIARAISVYASVWGVSLFGVEERVPLVWQHMLSWGSLRGGLAIIMVLLVPETLSFPNWPFEMGFRDFLMALTVGCIVFTLFVKALTITPFMRHFGIDRLHEVEQVGYWEGRILMMLAVLDKIETLHERRYMNDEERELLSNKYRADLETAQKEFKAFLSERADHAGELLGRILALHALGMERQALRQLFRYNEVSEGIFRLLMGKLESQIWRIEHGKAQFRLPTEDEEETDASRKTAIERAVEWLVATFRTPEQTAENRYVKARTRTIVSNKVLRGLSELRQVSFIAERPEFAAIVERYETFRTRAEDERQAIFDESRELVLKIDSDLLNRSLLKREEEVVDDLQSKEIVSPKLATQFRQEIEESFYRA
jgi:monovalent cation:H+ antiporter, CPA1 family